jgi:hypothetical protein
MPDPQKPGAYTRFMLLLCRYNRPRISTLDLPLEWNRTAICLHTEDHSTFGPLTLIYGLSAPARGLAPLASAY